MTKTIQTPAALLPVREQPAHVRTDAIAAYARRKGYRTISSREEEPMDAHHYGALVGIYDMNSSRSAHFTILGGITHAANARFFQGKKFVASSESEGTTPEDILACAFRWFNEAR